MNLGVFVSNYKQTTDTLDRIKADKLGLILVANGVYHATLKEGGKASAILDKTANLYVLSEDLQTRGINESTVDSRVKVVTMSDVVDIVFNDFKQIAWL